MTGAPSSPARRPSALVQRLLTAAIGIPVLFVVIKLGPVWLLFAVVSLFAALAAREACALLVTPIRRPLPALAMIGAVLVAVPFLLRAQELVLWKKGAEGVDHPLVLVLVLAAAMLGATVARAGLSEKVEAVLGTLFAVIFAGIPLGFLTALRAAEDEEMGRDLLVLLLVVIWVGDTAAMAAGARFGRHKLAPQISPRKTVEGALAGIAGGIGAALLAHVWWFHRLPIVHAILIGLVLSIAGICGDLAESVLKRAAGAKDSSGILPGHGGILDRIDSLLFAGPALYYYYQAVLR